MLVFRVCLAIFFFNSEFFIRLFVPKPVVYLPKHQAIIGVAKSDLSMTHRLDTVFEDGFVSEHKKSVLVHL